MSLLFREEGNKITLKALKIHKGEDLQEDFQETKDIFSYSLEVKNRKSLCYI